MKPQSLGQMQFLINRARPNYLRLMKQKALLKVFRFELFLVALPEDKQKFFRQELLPLPLGLVSLLLQVFG